MAAVSVLASEKIQRIIAQLAPEKKTICLTTTYFPDKEENIQTVTEHASSNHILSLHDIVLWVKINC